MVRKPILIVPLVLALAILACSINIDLPRVNVETGPTVTEDINVSLLPASTIADIELNFGAGRLDISPGAENALISGTATYNVNEFKPEVSVEGNKILMTQEATRFEGIPSFGDNVENRWELELNDAPMNLRIAAGAYRGRYEFGDLSLQNLHISDGAADAQVSFSQPNQIEMETLRYETGASSVTLTGLANANFEEMIFRGGAGDYHLEFTGDLQREAAIEIESGLSNLVITVPSGTAARIAVTGGLTNVDVRGDWRSSGSDQYTLTGEGPTLTFTVDLGAGNLELRN